MLLKVPVTLTRKTGLLLKIVMTSNQPTFFSRVREIIYLCARTLIACVIPVKIHALKEALQQINAMAMCSAADESSLSSFFTDAGNVRAPAAAGTGDPGGTAGWRSCRIHTVLNVLTAQKEEFAKEKTKSFRLLLYEILQRATQPMISLSVGLTLILSQRSWPC